MKPGTVVVEMRGVHKRFPGVVALRDARLTLRAGEVHVLLGENGAGKSTLMKILCGQYAPDEGVITFDGEPIRLSDPHAAEQMGLVMIHQELNLVESLTVAENIFLGQEPARAGFVDGRAMNDDARALLGRLRSTLDPRALVSSLSIAHKQLVELAKALRREARVIVMDEPTAALAANESQALFDVIADLTAAGVAVVYISHRMEEIFAVGHRITVMRDGEWTATFPLADVTPEQLIKLMVGRTIEEQIPKRAVVPGDAMLRVEGLGRRGVVAPTHFEVHAGEIFGIAGLMGSGRTELARLIFGADARDSGRLHLGDTELGARSGPQESIAAGLGFITEDRKNQGLVLMRSVDENVSLASLDAVCRGQALSLVQERERATRYVSKLRIRIASLQQKVGQLSGGNQQKVVLAKWLAAGCRVLIFDEPTRGIDVGAKAEIYGLIGELVVQGVAVILISSEMPELLGLADRIGVMHDGRMQGIIPRSEATQARIMAMALGRGG